MCHNGQLAVKFCPAHLHYNPGLPGCDYPHNVSCTLDIATTPATTIPLTTTTEIQPQPRCPDTKCQDSTIYLPDPQNINRYIRCVNGEEVYSECPESLTFDIKLSMCQLDHLAETKKIPK